MTVFCFIFFRCRPPASLCKGEEESKNHIALQTFLEFSNKFF